MNASFEERSTWVQLISLVLALGGYFGVAGWMLAAGITEIAAFVPLFAVSVVLLVVLLAAGHAAAAIAAGPERRDERDRMIAWKAEGRSSWLLGVGVLAAVAGLAAKVEPTWIAHLLLLSMLASEVLNFSLRLVSYRRGL